MILEDILNLNNMIIEDGEKFDGGRVSLQTDLISK